ncbi:hypothetical protein [Acinetobacter soli]|uniref:Uncharacterized protein n=1 Tax=Acinetobacter soli TaxID=487316 RepID=A0AB38YW31_9GAMM|nr:hypothetical protein [Acinetobacter soli]PPB85715.1 hypothetical protein AsoHEU7_13615 [Acinetobacter soli]WEI00866.1 hypothetical protein PYR77_02040 [Acinetobacter soli]WND05618.1 hypothetical protein RHP80_00120 [Acinetobacter soli]
MDGFFMVWCEQGFDPKFKHESLDSAEREAKRLALNNPGKQFHVLQSYSTFEQPELVKRTVHDRNDIPF